MFFEGLEWLSGAHDAVLTWYESAVGTRILAGEVMVAPAVRNWRDLVFEFQIGSHILYSIQNLRKR